MAVWNDDLKNKLVNFNNSDNNTINNVSNSGLNFDVQLALEEFQRQWNDLSEKIKECTSDNNLITQINGNYICYGRIYFSPTYISCNENYNSELSIVVDGYKDIMNNLEEKVLFKVTCELDNKQKLLKYYQDYKLIRTVPITTINYENVISTLMYEATK